MDDDKDDNTPHDEHGMEHEFEDSEHEREHEDEDDTMMDDPDQMWSGGMDDDHHEGGSGDDDMMGEGGDDHMLGHGGSDDLYGDDGNDDLDGGMGDDDMFGGAGQDILRAGYGHDYMHGGTGQDAFAFYAAGHFIVADFTAGDDGLYFDSAATGLHDLHDLVHAITSIQQVGDDVVVEFGTIASITFVGISVSDLHADMVHFV